MHPMLHTAIKAARRAGNLIQRASFDLDQLQINTKRQYDFVTEVDQAAENEIIRIIKEAYPDHEILAEERGLIPASAPSDYRWIIDPIDGTTNFIHGFPQYAISIALMYKQAPFLALVYDPTRNELFTAHKGNGAFLNDRRIRVSKRVQLKESLIATGFPFRDMDTLDRYLPVLRTVTSQCVGIRRPGAASLDLAYVAAGRLDGFFEYGLSVWDIAAGCLLVTEAGGLVTDLAGEPDYLSNGNIIAATPRVFSQLLSVIQSATTI